MSYDPRSLSQQIHDKLKFSREVKEGVKVFESKTKPGWYTIRYDLPGLKKPISIETDNKRFIKEFLEGRYA
jgi:hypothetical protein